MEREVEAVDDVTVSLEFSSSTDEVARQAVAQSFIDEGFPTTIGGDGLYKAFAVSPQVIIEVVLSTASWAFLKGFVNKAGEDAWDKVKGAFRRQPANDIGQEMWLKEGEETQVRYLLPADRTEWAKALEAIAEDYQRSDRDRERWWLGPPDSRWGSGEESARHGR